MDAPPVQYVTTSDGFRIAYGVSGSGTPLLFLPGVFYHVQLAWQYPGLEPWVRGLAERFQLIQLDPRGTGMSSRDVGEGHARVHYQRDIEAVLQRLDPGPLLLLAASGGVDLAVDYALAHPENVTALLLGTSGTSRVNTPMFEMLPAADWEVFLYSIVPRTRSREEADRIVELVKQASDQRNYLLRRRVLYAPGKIEEALARLQIPTLVMHARDYALTPVEEGMKIAQHSGGRLVLIDGADPWGDATQGIRAIEAFLAEMPSRHATRPQVSDSLSGREIEVLRLLAAGKSNQEIADGLVISVNTVRRHVSNLFDKTGVANRAQATAYAKDHRIA
jgi:DNA-binding CsgD family transcriptional regulator/pimeloyl-ACP methyl ester carboxylesterase